MRVRWPEATGLGTATDRTAEPSHLLAYAGLRLSVPGHVECRRRQDDQRTVRACEAADGGVAARVSAHRRGRVRCRCSDARVRRRPPGSRPAFSDQEPRRPNHFRALVRSVIVKSESGDDQAEFVAFVQACQHRLLRSAYLVCGDHHLAEDLLQGALVKLALRWPQVRDGHPEAFLRTVMYRDAVSWWRRWRREDLSDVVPEPVPPDGAEELSTRVVFENALRRLPPRQRAVLVLRYFDDLTEARTAEVLGVAVGTVKSQANAALRRLRELAPELGELARAGRED